MHKDHPSDYAVLGLRLVLLYLVAQEDYTVVPLLKATLTRGHPSYEARIFCPHYYKVIRFLPLAKGHLSYVATICSQIGWPYKRGTTVHAQYGIHDRRLGVTIDVFKLPSHISMP